MNSKIINILYWVVLIHLHINTFAQAVSNKIEVPANTTFIVKESIYLTKEFIVNENAILLCEEGIENVTIKCENFKVLKGAKIINKRLNGENGQNGTIRNRNGRDGNSGSNGTSFTIECRNFIFCDFSVNLSGGDGGKGGNGLQGEKGRNASCCGRPGGNGKKGGNGGNGGNGGGPGSFIIKYEKFDSPCNSTITSENFLLKAGVNGKGGKYGSGGQGGNNARGCLTGCNRSSGGKGERGNLGNDGYQPSDNKPVFVDVTIDSRK